MEKVIFQVQGSRPPRLQEHTYFVQGMRCASCEISIEKKLLELKEVKSVEASAKKGEVLVEFSGKEIPTSRLNHLFKGENYIFSDSPVKSNQDKNNEYLIILGTAILVAIGFLILNKLGFLGLVNVSAKSSLPAFFVFGLLAGISSCAALVGGIVLSMSKQWNDLYADKESSLQKLQPHILFNAGRLLSYAILGGVLGAIGSRLQISVRFTSLLIIAISVMMIFLALQMLGVKVFRRFQFTPPKFITRYIADETNFQGRYMPSILGALTFFLPCGFTITAQGLALLSGNTAQGALIMLLFALGTAPILLAIGFSSVKFSSRPHWGWRFAKIAGILVLFFAAFNINNQLNVLGFSSLNDILRSAGQNSSAQNNALTPVVNGKQIIKMDATASGYSPNYFKIKAGVPVKWEIMDKGTSGCTNAVISQGLFSDEIDLTPGQVSTKEFTPQKAGRYKFSCWMGMISGIIEVVDKDNAAPNNANLFTPSGAENLGGSCGINGGCGCGVK